MLSSIQGTLAFKAFKIVCDAWILPSRVVELSKKVPDLNCEVQELLLEVVDLKEEVPDSRSGGIPPPILPLYKTQQFHRVGRCLHPM